MEDSTLNSVPNPLYIRHIRYARGSPLFKDLVLHDRNAVIRIGRHTDNDFVIYHTTVCLHISKYHAIIEYKDDGFYILDLGSMNGTFLNDIRIEANVPTKLHPNDRLMFGSREEIPETKKYNLFQFLVTDKPVCDPVIPTDTLQLSTSQIDKIKNEFQCGICMDVLLLPYTLPCGHTTCADCIEDWLITRTIRSCPTCRVMLNENQRPVPCRVLKDAITAIVEPTLTMQEHIERQERSVMWQNKLDYKLKCAKRKRAADDLVRQNEGEEIRVAIPTAIAATTPARRSQRRFARQEQ